jgi:AraC-like DNA-binding protein
MDRHLLIEPTGRIDLLGVRFRPDGAYPFLKLPSQELTGSIASLDQVSAKLDREIDSRVQDSVSIPERIASMEKILVRQLDGVEGPDVVLRGAIEMILRTSGQISIDALADRLGVSGRQLERKFRQRVGIEPKLLCRIIRFQEIFQALERSEEGRWLSAALDCGYYDQAHFIRDFKRFSGLCPSSYFRESPMLAHYFTRKDRPSDLYNTEV